MKVHPGMLMKTNEARFQVSGARCQGAHRARSVIQGGLAAEKSTEMKIHPGMLMKTKKGRF